MSEVIFCVSVDRQTSCSAFRHLGGNGLVHEHGQAGCLAQRLLPILAHVFGEGTDVGLMSVLCYARVGSR